MFWDLVLYFTMNMDFLSWPTMMDVISKYPESRNIALILFCSRGRPKVNANELKALHDRLFNRMKIAVQEHNSSVLSLLMRPRTDSVVDPSTTAVPDTVI